MPMLLRVDPDQGLTELGMFTGERAKNLARDLSREKAGLEYLVDHGDRAELYRDGVYQGWIVSSTGKRASLDAFAIAKGLNTGR